ncbi:MAG: ChbG/HpnK family deacetylase [Caldimonas sp.]
MKAEHNQRTRVCVCADDFGMHSGVNEAALRLADLGRVHAIGALVGAPAWSSGWSALRHLPAATCDIGLHLDLTEFPLLEGTRRPLGRLIALGLLHRIDRVGVRAEIRAQLDAFESALGRGPVFVDGHQHVHQLPGIRDELLIELRHRYSDHLPWIRCTRGAARAAAGWSSRIKASVIERLGAEALADAAQRNGFLQNRALLGVYDFAGDDARYETLLRDWLRSARDGDLLMCHPGRRSAPDDPIAKARATEDRVLSSPAFECLLAECAVSLHPMSTILDRNHDACPR